VVLFDSPARRDSLLQWPETARSHGDVFVLENGVFPAVPWLEEMPGGYRRFRPEVFPRPRTLLGPEGERDHVEGLIGGGDWSGEEMSLRFDTARAPGRYLDLRLRGWRPAAAPALDGRVQAWLNGEALVPLRQEGTFFRFAVPAELVRPAGNQLRLRAPTFVPAAVNPASGDQRELGLDVQNLVLR
jgi:hypothetical protein